MTTYTQQHHDSQQSAGAKRIPASLRRHVDHTEGIQGLDQLLQGSHGRRRRLPQRSQEVEGARGERRRRRQQEQQEENSCSRGGGGATGALPVRHPLVCFAKRAIVSHACKLNGRSTFLCRTWTCCGGKEARVLHEGESLCPRWTQ